MLLVKLQLLLVKLQLLLVAADFLSVHYIVKSQLHPVVRDVDQLINISDNWMQLTLHNIMKPSAHPSPCSQQSPKKPGQEGCDWLNSCM